MLKKDIPNQRPNELFTQCHLLDHLERVGEARIIEMVKELGQHDLKLYKLLQRLIMKGFVQREIKMFKNHGTYFYSLTHYATRYRLKKGLYSWLQADGNPMYQQSKRIAEFHKEAKYIKTKTGEVVLVPEKQLLGFIE